jgi:Flp pilus assembly protein TadD
VRSAAFAVAAVATLVAFVGLVGNIESSRAGSALQEGNWAKAETHARRAHRWMPWSPDPNRQLGEAERAQGRFADAREAFRAAIAKDPRDWESWLDLGRATTGGAQRDARRHVAELDPLSPELVEFRSELQQGWALVDEIRA